MLSIMVMVYAASVWVAAGSGVSWCRDKEARNQNEVYVSSRLCFQFISQH